MKQQDFEQRYVPLWESFERWLKSKDQHIDVGATGAKTLSTGDLPKAYRQICHHLALCRSRNYSPRLEERLNRLALSGHRHLYAKSAKSTPSLVHFFAHEFPASARRNWVYIAIMAVLFYGTLFGMVATIFVNPPIVYSVISAPQVAEIEEMYDPSADRIGARDSGDDVAMFGFYVFNNISIGFRTFASGLLAGLGALYVILQNGIILGAVMGHLSANGYGSTLWPFISGHGALELNAIVIAGGSGLKIGWSVIAPGRRRRVEALRVAAGDAMPLVYGFTAMLLGAAFIEAFWSSTTWPAAALKYAVGAFFWLLVLSYFFLAGRARGS